jgi:hypothetical protein
MSDSPPSSWYDPPLPRHRDKTVIPDECNCSECHEWHISEGLVIEQFDNSDFQCCVDQMDEWITEGQRCEKHPKAYVEPPTKEDPKMHCEECEPEWFK